MAVLIRFPCLCLLALAVVITAGVSVLAQEVESSKPAKDNPPTRTDRYSDPLPDGVVARLGTAPWRPGINAWGLVYSHDGSLVASAVRDRSIRLWDAATGRRNRSRPESRCTLNKAMPRNPEITGFIEVSQL
jgi:WD40 repeat protein